MKNFIKGILLSYSQIFFSNNFLFAFILFFITFIDYNSGICGFFSVIVTNGLAYIMKYNRKEINSGVFGFNSLLVGLGVGIYYEPSILLFVIVFISAIFTFFITISLKGIIGKYSLPYLSIPFLIAIWIVSLSARHFIELEISQRGLFIYNTLFALGGKNAVEAYELQNIIALPSVIKTYFLSLGAIFFQFNMISGIIISIGLIIYSRIAFSLSLLGFFTAYFFYQLLGADFSELGYSYIGFNYILTSIAIGGFFLVPSKMSYIWTVLLIPITAMITLSLSTVFAIFQLSIYSLPFNMIVLIFLYAIKFRESNTNNLQEVWYQKHSPEKNLYAWLNNKMRFGKSGKTKIFLPFHGEWVVTQGIEGDHTHKENWKYAWDFMIVDENKNSFENKGDLTEDYYCYNKTVLAPANGIVEMLIDNIEDNKIGETNLENNWGNTIIIKHENNLYSNLSHLKKGSITVKKGDHVTVSQVIGNVGNSGNSPYPHLHFQLQSEPYIGATTMEYPIAGYISHSGINKEYKTFALPAENQIISNVQPNSLIKKAFSFIPGKVIDFEVTTEKIVSYEHWEIKANIYNQTYFFCKKSDSYLYFQYYQNTLFFTEYIGSKKSLLYYFYLLLYKNNMGFYPGLAISDSLSLSNIYGPTSLFFQDFIAPFYVYLKARFLLQHKKIDHIQFPKAIEIESQISKKQNKPYFKGNIFINKVGIDKIKILFKGKTIEAKCINE